MSEYILEAVDVIKHYKQYDQVVYACNRANMKVKDGEFVAIVGSSGSGKSTFLHICAGLMRPNDGRVLIRGTDIAKLKPDALARFRGNHIGIVFQNHNLIPQLTALENILVPTVMCAREDHTYEEHLKKLIKALDLENRLHHLPSELSGGQRQRVAAARALINKPDILFADEPTGNLDRDSAGELIDLLLATRAELGQTLVMVTHDPSVAALADRIYHMENGVLREQKPTE